MTSPSSTRTGGAAPPGDRPHLPPVSTTSRRTDRRTPLAWLPWLLVGLLLLTLLAAALLARAAGGGDADGAASADRGRTAAQNDAAGDGAAAGSAGALAAGALTAGGQDLLAVEGGTLSSLVGQQAEGTATVQAVVADEGFWVGPSAQKRVFVFLTPEARRSAGESGFQVETGQTVQLAGSVKATSAQFAQTAGVSADEGAEQLVSQGGYVEATQVRLAG